MSKVRDMIIDRCLRKRAFFNDVGKWISDGVNSAFLPPREVQYNPNQRQKMMNAERNLHGALADATATGIKSGFFGSLTNINTKLNVNNATENYRRTLASQPTPGSQTAATEGLSRRMSHMGKNYYQYNKDPLNTMKNLTAFNSMTPKDQEPSTDPTDIAIKKGMQGVFVNSAWNHLKKAPMKNMGDVLYYSLRNTTGLDLPWLRSPVTGYVAGGAALLGAAGLAAYAFGGGGGGGSERGDDGDDDYDRSTRFAHNTSWWPSGLSRTTNYARAAQMRG